MKATVQSTLIAAFLLVVVSTVSGQILGFGGCPQPPVKANFSATKYKGVWYEIERYRFTAFELLMKCGQVNYTLLSNKHIRVVNTGIRKFTGSKHVAIGDAFAPDPSEPAKLQVNFSNKTVSDNRTNYWVLDTDYTNYTLVYSCSQVLDGIAHADVVWILGRQRTLPRDTLKKLYGWLQDHGLRTWPLFRTDQKNCDSEVLYFYSVADEFEEYEFTYP